MKIYLNIEADNPAELDEAIRGLAKSISAVTAVSATVVDPDGNAPVDAAPAVEKKTRAKKADAAPVKEEAKVEETAPEPAKEETKAITADEVRNTIIDFLNDWSDAAPNDPDVRVKNLKPILEALGAEKIGTIDPTKYHLVAGLVDDGRARLAEFKAQSSVEE